RNLNAVDQFKFSTETEEKFLEDINKSVDRFSNRLMKVIDEKINGFITDGENEIYQKLISVIEDRIGDKYSLEWISKVEVEGEGRYEKQIPPGYSDVEKSEQNEPIRRYSEIEYQRKFGDLIIWQDIIEKAKDRDVEGDKVVFVTNDGTSKRKSDLLYKVKGMTVGPSISMMNELYQESKKKFYIMDNFRFVTKAQNLNDEEASQLKEKLKMKTDEYRRNSLLEEHIKNQEYPFEFSNQLPKFEFESNYPVRKKETNEDNLFSSKSNDNLISKAINEDTNKGDFISNSDRLNRRNKVNTDYYFSKITLSDKKKVMKYFNIFQRIPSIYEIEDILNKEVSKKQYMNIINYIERRLRED